MEAVAVFFLDNYWFGYRSFGTRKLNRFVRRCVYFEKKTKKSLGCVAPIYAGYYQL